MNLSFMTRYYHGGLVFPWLQSPVLQQADLVSLLGEPVTAKRWLETLEAERAITRVDDVVQPGPRLQAVVLRIQREVESRVL